MVDQPDIREIEGFSLATILARKDIDALTIGKALEANMPAGPNWTAGDKLQLLGTARGTWLAYAEAGGHRWIGWLTERLAGLAAISDQSGSARIWRISGASATRLLARGAAIDFQPENFPVGAVAVTSLAHVGVTIRKLNARPSYDIIVPRSYGSYFQGWAERTAASL